MACECMDMAVTGPESTGQHHHVNCPKYKTEKFPTLFYYEEAINSWTPAPDNIEHMLCVEDQLEDGEKIELEFKRIDLTDAEFDAMPVE